MRNNNPLNIRKGEKWEGLRKDQSKDKEFCQFKSKMYGYRAAFRILKTYLGRGWNTPEKIIQHWAPECENNTEEYINYVCVHTWKKRDEVLDFGNLPEVVAAMAWFESRMDEKGEFVYIKEAYKMAFNE